MFITKDDFKLIVMFSVSFIVGILIGFNLPHPEPTYQLVQIKDGNAYVMDFNQSWDDCKTQVQDNPKANLACMKEQ